MLTLVGVSGLTGCSSRATQARDRYEFLKQQHASYADVCSAGKEMVRAYSEAGDKERYREADTSVDVDCVAGELKGPEQPYGEGKIEADNMAIMAPDQSNRTVR